MKRSHMHCNNGSITLVFAVVALMFAVTQTTSGQGASPDLLFVSAVDVPVAPVGKEAWVERQRLARADTVIIQGIGERTRQDVLVDVFDDVSFAIRFTQDILSEHGSVVTRLGQTAGASVTNVAAVVNNGLLTLDIFDVDGVHYAIRPIINDVYSVEEFIATAGSFQCTAVAPPLNLTAGASGCEDGSRIDLMIVYTHNAHVAWADLLSTVLLIEVLSNWGPCPALGEDCMGDLNGDGVVGMYDLLILLDNWLSETHFNAAIDSAVARANLSYFNSRIDLRLDLVHREEISYVEDAASCVLTLNRLTSTIDGHMDEVHELRDIYLADVVTLVSTACGPTAGIAWVMNNPGPGFASLAFNVVGFAFGVSRVLSHEVGHNMGCGHEWGDSRNGAYPYSKGHRFPVEDPLYKTVMATSSGATLRYFSNPDVFYEGYPTGVPEGEEFEADNARTIRQTAAIVANFREDCP